MAKGPTYEQLKNKVRELEKQIREQKCARQEHLKRERLQGVLEMAGAVCHELNQPVQVLSVYSELLSQSVCEETDLKKEITSMIDKIDRIAWITRKLSMIASYETKEYIEGRKIIDIEKACQAVC